VVATGNPGCALQLAASLRRLGRGDIRIVHPVELLM
jgi:Fe-S oxidoreductase